MTIKNVKSFTIDRARWARGGMNGDAALKNEDGNMCCLGFYARACGFSIEDKDKDFPLDSLANIPNCGVLKGKFRRVLKNESEFIDINDEPDMQEDDREKTIKDLFKEAGVTVKFKG